MEENPCSLSWTGRESERHEPSNRFTLAECLDQSAAIGQLAGQRRALGSTPLNVTRVVAPPCGAAVVPELRRSWTEVVLTSDCGIWG